MGQFDEALPWFERAVAEKEQGDMFGRVDQKSVEVSRSRLRASLGKQSSNDDPSNHEQ
jgi:hypothetical protein